MVPVSNQLIGTDMKLTKLAQELAKKSPSRFQSLKFVELKNSEKIAEKDLNGLSKTQLHEIAKNHFQKCTQDAQMSLLTSSTPVISSAASMSAKKHDCGMVNYRRSMEALLIKYKTVSAIVETSQCAFEINGVIYKHCFNGAFCRVTDYLNFLIERHQITRALQEYEAAELKIDSIIHRELDAVNFWSTGQLKDALENLSIYKITKQKVIDYINRFRTSRQEMESVA